MPWASTAQARWGHSPTGVKALGGAAKVAEWDHATKPGSLPKRVKGAKVTVGDLMRRKGKPMAAPAAADDDE